MIVKNAEIRSRLHPKVIRQAGMHIGRIKVLLGMRRHRQQRAIHVRSMPAAFNRRPVLVLHHDDPYSLHVGGHNRLRLSKRNGDEARSNQPTPNHQTAISETHLPILSLSQEELTSSCLAAVSQFFVVVYSMPGGCLPSSPLNNPTFPTQEDFR